MHRDATVYRVKGFFHETTHGCRRFGYALYFSLCKGNTGKQSGSLHKNLISRKNIETHLKGEEVRSRE